MRDARPRRQPHERQARRLRVRPGRGLFDEGRVCDGQVRDFRERAVGEGVHHEAEDFVAWLQGGGGGVAAGGEDGAGEVATGDFGGGEGGWVGEGPEREVHDLDVDGVEGAGVDAEEEVAGGAGGGGLGCGGGEGEGRWVRGCGVGPGIDRGGGGGRRGGHGVEW